MNLVDSCGWLEYFAGGGNSEFFSQAIENVDELVVSTINIYEVFKKILIQRGESDAFKAISLMYQAKVIHVTPEISLYAAQLSYEYKLPMADSLILSSAKTHNAILWTQDSDFKDIEGVKYVKK